MIWLLCFNFFLIIVFRWLLLNWIFVLIFVCFVGLIKVFYVLFFVFVKSKIFKWLFVLGFFLYKWVGSICVLFMINVFLGCNLLRILWKCLFFMFFVFLFIINNCELVWFFSGVWVINFFGKLKLKFFVFSIFVIFFISFYFGYFNIFFCFWLC